MRGGGSAKTVWGHRIIMELRRYLNSIAKNEPENRFMFHESIASKFGFDLVVMNNLLSH